MKLTTTLLATLIFASTGAIANTTKLTEQDELLIEKAANLNISRCVDRQLGELEENPERLNVMRGAFEQATYAVAGIYDNLEIDAGYVAHRKPTVMEVTTMLVANCLPRRR
ncbi:hypothetical protein [Vibrio campbellii]|uniref:Uncharacterized protein n=3 Tax=Vibrio campbellii TaxID=680 RepID=A7N3B1_VIBC1|nr:hypothetical protein [Vibrio campbellii]ABU72927.1 hypothetical protein VIBHAR_05020 [Vibrio campbellii ATCC BAA-1116]AGU98847.1 hypothetical protein M892_26095 [Vibrio campbellii ATCC BAA-1116]MBT0121267.1 hypothetical protein [Vibrio campbellii]MBT0136404.1 hypothetical protein [Vibrio campbellii]MBT0141034.1 hypothetical protein [Vibrio campbellii]